MYFPGFTIVVAVVEPVVDHAAVDGDRLVDHVAGGAIVVRRAEDAAMHRVARAWRGASGPAEASIETVCDHVEHVAGDDAVAFGSDFDGVPDLPRGLENCGRLPNVHDALRARGWNDARLHKLAWANVLRVLAANE